MKFFTPQSLVFSPSTIGAMVKQERDLAIKLDDEAIYDLVTLGT